MHHGQMRPRPKLTALLILAAAACSDATGPTYPRIEGQYAATVSFTFQNEIESFGEGTGGHTITLYRPSGSGSFTGSFVYSNGSSGPIAGVVRRDGGLTIHEWGDGSAAGSAQAVSNLLDWCDLGLAGSSGLSGSVSGTQLTITATVSMPCYYTSGFITRGYATVLTITLKGNRR